MRRQKIRTGRNQKSPTGRLRIVAGKWRSRLLPVANEVGLRPTPERVRETLFNWLSPDLEGCRCLDLFAGSGALGFEALSRGAESCTFVELSNAAVQNLQSNISLLDASGASVWRGDARKFLLSVVDQEFDLVFLDPPFADDLLQDLCRLLAGSNVLAPRARIYLERERGQKFPDLPEEWTILKEKLAGNVRYALVQVQELME